MADFALTIFTSKGTLQQIENASQAVNKGETALGIKTKSCVVLAVEKKISSVLVDESSFHKVQAISSNSGAVYSGLGPDFRVLMQQARKHAQTYALSYREPILISNLVRETAQIVQEYTQSGGVRPFGISTLIAGFDDDGPHLYQIDPSGAYYEWKATAIGKNMKNAKIFLEKRYKHDLELEDAIHTALLTLKENFEGQMSSKNIELGIIDKSRVFRLLTPSEINDYLTGLES
eukprot:TRINITY_DN1322_c0_g1_i3.p1 TRINITY_DN1322_c0_g1~~TRINITY_DN1322_c0_g1_i3.p1  ORF type:complete len:233 (-),score=81.18 TRINITY_DN1322_c0_g1_i3:129-827(-)